MKTPTITKNDPDTVDEGLLRVNPRQLVVAANVRDDARLDEDFLVSVKTRGVLEPIVAYRDADGELAVLFGQRRTLAAVKTRRPTVPVVVVAKPADADRITDQFTENTHRAGLTVTEQANTYRQLAALGLSADQIANRTSTKRGQVDAGLAVAACLPAQKAAEQYAELTLDHVAAIAEFDGDENATQRLLDAAENGGFEHTLQRLRDLREETEEARAAAEPLVQAGVKVLDRRPTGPGVGYLDNLLHDGEPITVEDHVSCPGHAAFMDYEWVDVVDDGPEDSADEGEDEDEDEYGEDGRREWGPVFVCTDYATNGHTHRFSSSSRTSSGAMTDAQREAESKQRREVIAGNKAWVSAETVRRTWLRNLLARKTPPAGAAQFIATTLARADYTVVGAFTSGSNLGVQDLAHRLFGLPGEPSVAYGERGQEVAKLGANSADGRALVVALGIVLAAYESTTGKHTWRHQSSSRKPAAVYLEYLRSIGYELSEIEQRVCASDD